MDTDNEPTLIELEMQLREYYDEMKQLIKEKDKLTTLVMEIEFKIFNKKYRINDKSGGGGSF